jgi:threonine/homoserine/homoserine lactone efflux protein
MPGPDAVGGLGAGQLLAFNGALLAAMAAPGPALLMAVRASLAGGRAAGIATGVGLATMAACWTLAALLGLDALFALFPWAYGAARLAGALYLLWLAWGMWRDARKPVGAAPPRTGRARVVEGMLVNLANPKSVLFAAAVLVVIFPAEMSLAARLIVALNHFVLEVIVYAALATALSTPAARAGYLRLKAGLDRIAAAVLGALGLRLLLER